MKPINPKFNRKCSHCEFFKFRMLWPDRGTRFKLFEWSDNPPELVYEGTDPDGIDPDQWPDEPRLFVYGNQFVGIYYWDGLEFVLAEKRARVW